MNITDKEREYLKELYDIELSEDLKISISDDQLEMIANQIGEDINNFRINYLIDFAKLGNESEIIKHWLDDSCEYYDKYNKVLLNLDNQYKTKTKWILSKISFDDQYQCSYCNHIEHYEIILGIFDDYKKAYNKILQLIDNTGYQIYIDDSWYGDYYYFYFMKNNHVLYDQTYFHLRKFEVLTD